MALAISSVSYTGAIVSSNIQCKSIPQRSEEEIVMEPTITSEVVVAYSQCPRKAHLLLYSQDKGEPHEYVRILEQERCENQRRYVDRLKQKHPDIQPYTVENLRNGNEFLINARLKAHGFEAECDVLTRVEGKSTFGRYSYEGTFHETAKVVNSLFGETCCISGHRSRNCQLGFERCRVWSP
jgi:hypothetical protein